MKTTSVIFLIFSLVIIIAGVSICLVASSMADSNGVEIFYGENGSSGIQNYDFGIDGITRINLDLFDCDVTILGGSDSSYIEFVNYPGGIFSYSVEGKDFNFKDYFSVSSFDDITNVFVSFEGIRHFLKFDEYLKNDLSVIIHISEDYPPKVLNIKVENGSITAQNVNSLTDYIFLTENGDIKAENLFGASLGSFESSGGNINILNSDFSDLKVKAEKNALVSVNDISLFNYTISSKKGSVFVNDAEKSASFSGAGISAEKNILIESNSGNAKLVY